MDIIPNFRSAVCLLAEALLFKSLICSSIIFMKGGFRVRANSLIQAGKSGFIAYLTGRDVERMGVGTVEILLQWDFSAA